jgi:hypothetical protein
MKSKLSPLSRIDQLVHNLGPMNILVDKIVSKIAPKTMASAACNSVGCTVVNKVHIAWYCWAQTDCGTNKCVEYYSIGWNCNAVGRNGCIGYYLVCKYKNCAGPSNC